MMLGNQALQQTRDSIGSNPQVLPIPIITPERVELWQEPVVIYDKDIDNSFILSHSDNGVLGTATALGGGQVVLGDTDNFETLLRVQP
jgi:hypothetical protein